MTTSVAGLGAATVLDRVAQLAEELARDHTRRQGARQLSQDDFDAVALAPNVGIVRAAMASTKQQLKARGGIRGSLEAVEWAGAQADGWLLDQAFEGVLRATETSCSSAEFDLETKLAKLAACELAESALRHASGAIGGSSYSAFSPIGWWHEDVRAMGLLRPTLNTLVDDVGSRGGQ
jgi:alkylation response protein AidB-like acyl-CoA dehydrogenase